MFYPIVSDDGNTRSMINTWRGYNHNAVVSAGEFYDMENMSSDYYPLLTPRKKRALLAEGDNIRGLLYSDNDICYLEGDVLHYGTRELDLSPYMDETGGTEKQTLLRFGAYILIFPLAIYVNVYDTSDCGTMKTRFVAEQGKTVTYSICKSDGSDYDNVVVSDNSPESPSDGMYWLSTGENKGLYIWYGSEATWQPVATTYIRIALEGARFTDYFAEDDTVTLNTKLTDINDGSNIEAIDDDYIVVTGLLNKVTDTEKTTSLWTLKIERKIPTLDYVLCDKNRVWGCYYGYTDKGEMVNEIYCSKLGDFKNWYTYKGISTDAYAVSVGTSGAWTGAISYKGYPTFFKENAIFKIYGSYPAEYQIVENSCRGVQTGCSESLAVVGDYLLYKSPSDVVVYDGSTPTSISEDLGRETYYYDAVGGGCLNKYHLVMETVTGKHHYFVYDLQHGIWEKEDAVSAVKFSTSENGQIYMITKKKLYGLGNTDNRAYENELVGEEYVEWYATTGELGFDNVDYKHVNRISIRAHVPHTSEIIVEIAYEDRPFEEVGVLRGTDSIAMQTLNINPYPCDYYRIKFRGHGNVKIYSMAITQELGSDDYGN